MAVWASEGGQSCVRMVPTHSFQEIIVRGVASSALGTLTPGIPWRFIIFIHVDAWWLGL